MNTLSIDAGAELNIVHAAELRQSWISLMEAEHDAIDIDASSVQEIDSAGLQLLLALHKGCLQQGKSLRLKAPSRAVRDVLEIFGLANHFSQA